MRQEMLPAFLSLNPIKRKRFFKCLPRRGIPFFFRIAADCDDLKKRCIRTPSEPSEPRKTKIKKFRKRLLLSKKRNFFWCVRRDLNTRRAPGALRRRPHERSEHRNLNLRKTVPVRTAPCRRVPRKGLIFQAFSANEQKSNRFSRLLFASRAGRNLPQRFRLPAVAKPSEAGSRRKRKNNTTGRSGAACGAR